jgi:hypothetical protein
MASCISDSVYGDTDQHYSGAKNFEMMQIIFYGKDIETLQK